MASIFGEIGNPLKEINPTKGYGELKSGLPSFISNALKIVFIGAGLFAFLNLIFAGFLYMSANGDKQKIEKATMSINMSLMGLIVMVAAGVLTGIISFLLFGSATAILKPTIIGPGTL
ncbi:MAG: hypothetical protein ABII80_02345 [bacterium]